METYDVAYTLFGTATGAGLLLGLLIALFNSWGV